MLKLFHGKDSFLSLDQAKGYAQTLKKKYPQFSHVQIDCSSEEKDKIIQTYQSFDMFSNGKIILLKRILEHQDSKEISKNLIEFSDKNSDIDTQKMNLLVWEPSKVRSNTRFYKLFKAKGEIYESPNLNKRTFITWAKKHIKGKKLKMASAVIYELAQRADFDTQRFANEVEKLELTEKTSFTKEDLETYTSDTYQIDIWKLIDGLNKSQPKLSTTSINKLFEQNVDPYYIFAMIARNLRQIVQTKSLSEKQLGNSEICSILRIPPFTLPALKRKAAHFNWERLALIYEKTNNLDYEMKTGRIDPKLGLTLLLTIL
ncbi:DNA polymerase III subunit delta [Candidatus Dojkabacteria bacterium]|nr:DNA polymerase III subunit delta [Candidatus Dojkabacteria bacterium]